MNLKEFQELPIGTVLEFDSDCLRVVTVKVSKNCDMIISGFMEKRYDRTDEIWSYKKYKGALEFLELAPSYQWMFEVK